MISQYFSSNLPLLQIVLKEAVCIEESSSLYCVQTSSFLFVGMWSL